MATAEDNPNSGALTTIVLAGAFAMVVIVGVVTAVVRMEVDAEVERKGGGADVKPYRDLVAKQRTAIQSPIGWSDKEQGEATVPIGLAKKIVIQELAAAAASAASAAPAGSASAAPAGSASAAPAASASADDGEAPGNDEAAAHGDGGTHDDGAQDGGSHDGTDAGGSEESHDDGGASDKTPVPPPEGKTHTEGEADGE